MAQKVQFVETVLRDANQSLIATRLPFEKFAPMLETIDKVGYYAIECWGGATFDVCLRYLNEDPWERLRKIRAKMPNTKLQMLLRGQNVLGYSHYPDDFVKLFVKKAVENGIDVIRIFDALNDTNNLKVAMDAAVNAGAIASGCISYTTSPVHTHKKYVEIVKEMKEMGVEYFNVGTGIGYSVLDIVKAYEKATGKAVPYVIAPRRPGDIDECYADPTKAYELLGWKAQYGIEDMCRDANNWQTQNPDGYGE